MRGRSSLRAALLLGLAAMLSSCGSGQDAAGSGPGGAFELADTQGRRVTDRTLAGRPHAIFFGFARCPDVCPTTMARMGALHKALGKDADKLRIVFVSVDPERDKPEVIASFLSMFDVPVLGLTGTRAQLESMEERYGVYVRKVPLADGDYTIDHTAGVMLFDSQGRFVEMLDASARMETNLAQLRKLTAG